MAITPMIEAPTISTTRFEYLVVPLKEAKNVKKDEDVFAPEQLNELGEEGWEAVGLSLKYGDFIAWPVVLLKRPGLSQRLGYREGARLGRSRDLCASRSLGGLPRAVPQLSPMAGVVGDSIIDT